MKTEILGYMLSVPEEKTSTVSRNDPKNLNRGARFKIIQKFLGAALVGLGMLSIPLSGGDGTVFLFTSFVGSVLMLTKENTFKDK